MFYVFTCPSQSHFEVGYSHYISSSLEVLGMKKCFLRGFEVESDSLDEHALLKSIEGLYRSLGYSRFAKTLPALIDSLENSGALLCTTFAEGTGIGLSVLLESDSGE